MQLPTYNVWTHTSHHTWNLMCHAQWRLLALLRLDRGDKQGARVAASRAREFFRLATEEKAQ